MFIILMPDIPPGYGPAVLAHAISGVLFFPSLWDFRKVSFIADGAASYIYASVEACSNRTRTSDIEPLQLREGCV